MTNITKNTLIGDLIKSHPKAVPLMQKQGLHCVGCHVATWETLEQGAQSHGIDVDNLIRELNKVLK